MREPPQTLWSLRWCTLVSLSMQSMELALVERLSMFL